MSYRFSIDPKSRKVGRFLGRVRREIQKAYAEEKASRGLTQAEIARALGVDRSVINRQLMGTENLTLRRVGEFAWILGREPRFSLTKPEVRVGANDVHSTTMPDTRVRIDTPPTEGPTSVTTSTNVVTITAREVAV
jgi:plasmid maintenance system antidote protein VapI